MLPLKAVIITKFQSGKVGSFMHMEVPSYEVHDS